MDLIEFDNLIDEEKQKEQYKIHWKSMGELNAKMQTM